MKNKLRTEKKRKKNKKKKRQSFFGQIDLDPPDENSWISAW